MANPLAFGFMDPRQAEMMNWEQSRPAMGPIEAMAGMPDLYRQAAQQQYSHQPMADSFLRRFGQPMPEQQQQSPMQPDMLQALMAQGGMIDAMTNQGAQDAGTSFMQNARGGEGLAQYSGKLADQPWLDEFANAGRQGVDLPMLQGHAGPQSDAMKAGIAERRQQRLGTPVPMNDRRNAVQQKAIAKSEQRASRMGDLSPNQQYLNEAGRFAGNMGEGGQDFLNGIFFGGQTAADMQGHRTKAEEAQATREWASSPEGIRAAQASGGQPVSSLYSLQQEQEDPQGFALKQAAGAAPDFESFVAMVGDRNLARQYWVQVGKPDPDAPQRPLGQKLFGDILYKGFGFDDPNRSTARGFMGNWLSDALGIQ